MDEATDVLNHPQHTTKEDELTVYQKLINKNNKQYLLRIFVNELKQPHLVVTGHTTSKINKYQV